jgi:hypothetical protein
MKILGVLVLVANVNQFEHKADAGLRGLKQIFEESRFGRMKRAKEHEEQQRLQQEELARDQRRFEKELAEERQRQEQEWLASESDRKKEIYEREQLKWGMDSDYVQGHPGYEEACKENKKERLQWAAELKAKKRQC